MANISDVARLAGVSPMTVSRVINHSGHVKEETRLRVLRAMKELNYVPNDLARSLVRRRTDTLALIVPDITNPFFTTVARGTEDTARKNDFRVVLCNSDEDPAKELEYIRMCVSIRVDGVIIAAAGDGSRKNLELLDSFEIPYVLVDRKVDGVQADVVTGDSRMGAFQLVKHLIDLGHRDIAMITGFLTTSTARERRDGYRRALEEHGIPFREAWVKETSYMRNMDFTLVEQLLDCTPRPTAIFAANNFLAVQVIRGLRHRGLRVPEDMAVVCFDDVDPYSLVEPFLTVASQPAYNFGTIATQLLIERIEHGEGPAPSPRSIVLQPEVIIRKSSGH
ncbi:substrate-binding domain-containing protein [Alicyclobacillus macrosporangiidus]|uniref:LacI family transcriptional regulator n=1 Tax=Alicyclobacillus macrosporangiidus TaxID=392015 RepID=A0A1I7JHN6_9BACL|nr:substrate-binding domain-containing protein [Alicyclobacillus macrosporangiidus]SFU84704.1 LacI family transcriptional regulator [Alicyclobacillus macrosporangiidus]